MATELAKAQVSAVGDMPLPSNFGLELGENVEHNQILYEHVLVISLNAVLVSRFQPPSGSRSWASRTQHEPLGQTPLPLHHGSPVDAAKLRRPRTHPQCWGSSRSAGHAQARTDVQGPKLHALAERLARAECSIWPACVVTRIEPTLVPNGGYSLVAGTNGDHLG